MNVEVTSTAGSWQFSASLTVMTGWAWVSLHGTEWAVVTSVTELLSTVTS